MTSGIYRLLFKSGHFYIGKSKDVERRWKEHFDKFHKGTAAKNMQWCFDNYGYPDTEVIVKAHPEHLDVLEPILIHNNWNEKILNSTKEICAEDMKSEFLDLCKLSLGTLCKMILDRNKEIEDLQEELEEETSNFTELIEDIKSGTELEFTEIKLNRAEDALKEYKRLLSDKEEEFVKYKNRSFFQRLFGN